MNFREFMDWWARRARDDGWRHYPVVDTPESGWGLNDSVEYLGSVQQQMDNDPTLLTRARGKSPMNSKVQRDYSARVVMRATKKKFSRQVSQEMHAWESYVNSLEETLRKSQIEAEVSKKAADYVIEIMKASLATIDALEVEVGAFNEMAISPAIQGEVTGLRRARQAIEAHALSRGIQL